VHDEGAYSMITTYCLDLPKVQDVQGYEKLIKETLLPVLGIIESYRYSVYIALLWLVFSVLVGVFASHVKGRSGIGFFFLSLFFSPVLAFLVALSVKTDWWARARKRGLKQCERCGRYVPREAVICHYCRGNFI